MYKEIRDKLAPKVGPEEASTLGCLITVAIFVAIGLIVSFVFQLIALWLRYLLS